MFKELEILKLQLEILTEKYDDTNYDEWTSAHDRVLRHLDLAVQEITKAQEEIANTYTEKETQ